MTTPAHQHAAAADTPKRRNPLAQVMSGRDFRLLICGAGASLLGDQFSLIATPWLVLQLTGDPIALGLVLALQGIPRAALMLFGGTLTDRLSPRRVMLAANLVRGVLTALLATAVATGTTQLWMVYAVSALFGIVAGVAVPAENSIVPQVVRKDDLQAGNSVMMGITQLTGFVGPTLAGLLIGRYAHSLTGVSIAFTIDAATFAGSAVCLLLITPSPRTAPSHPDGDNVLTATAAGIRYMWTDTVLRVMFANLLVVNFLLLGPIMVGIPLLADQRLPEGATAFGLLLSAFAVGNLVGYILAGSLPRPDGRRMRQILIGVVAAFGVIIGSLGYLRWTWLDFALLAVLGLGNGFIAVLLITWMQARTPETMTGRLMSLMTLATTGMVPVSEAIAGVAGTCSLTLLFVAPGALVLLLSAWMVFMPTLKALGQDLAAHGTHRSPGTAAETATTTYQPI